MITHTTTPALTLPLRTPRAIHRPPVRVAEAGPRFTTDGSLELEAHLARTCEKIAAGIRGLVSRRLEGILLGGGYGRGEGGVWRTPAGDRPYNDLEFYVCLHGNRHLNELRFGRALHVLGEILTPQAGVEVEFKITSLAELARRPISMFTYDLLLGHRWLVGGEDLLAPCAHHREAEQLPVSEATRLLMNRCSGLLLARERLEREKFTAVDADFVQRNLAKAELALGDAVLVAFGEYHWSARERHHRLQRLDAAAALPWLGEIRQRHARGVEFKLHPERSEATRETLRAGHTSLTALAQSVWLWIESRRLGSAFATIHDYVAHPRDKWPDESAARNLLVNAKALGMHAALRRRGFRHPRERVLHALTLLLWHPKITASPERVRFVQEELRTSATTFPGLVGAYRELWSRVS